MPPSPQKYELVFPDGHVIHFADFNESVNYIACKPFHKPLSFNGRIVDNLASWKIAISPDRTTYRIRLPFEKETKMIPVEFVGDKLPPHKDRPSFLFPFGQYFPDPGVWKVEGTEIVKLKAPIEIKIADKKGFAVKSAKYNGEKLRIELSPLYRYDVTDLLSDLSKRFNHEAELTLSEQKTGKTVAIFNSNLTRLSLPYRYHEVVLHIPESEFTMPRRVLFSQDGKIYPFEIKDKPLCKIIVKIDVNGLSDLKSRLDQGKNAGVICWEIVREKYREKNSVNIIGGIIEIKALPDSDISIQVRLDGYKPIYEVVNGYGDVQMPKIVIVRPKLKLSKRIVNVLKKNLGYIIVGIICFVTGFMIGQQTKKETTQQVTEGALSETVDPKDKTGMVVDLVDSCGMAPAPTEDTEEISVNGSSLTAEQNQMIRRLKGTKFTREDVQIAKEELKGFGEDDLIRDAEACLRILNLSHKEKKMIQVKGSDVYNLAIRPLSYHRPIMMEIVNSDAYLKSTKTNFKSIEEMKGYIERESERNMKHNTSQDHHEPMKKVPSL